MPITFSCPGCGKRFQVRDDRAGQRTKCPQCGGPLTVPQSTAIQTNPYYSSPASEPPTAEIVEYAPLVPAPLQAQVPAVRAEQTCPFCGEAVLAVAKKCKHCGEVIDVVLRAADEARRAARDSARQLEHTEAPAVYVTNYSESSSSAAADVTVKVKSSHSESFAALTGVLMIVACGGVFWMCMSGATKEQELQQKAKPPIVAKP